MAAPKDKNAIKIIEARKRLLTALNMLYPSPVSVRQLWRSACHKYSSEKLEPLDPTYDFSLFQKDLAYFLDKGWIEFIDDRLGGYDDYFKKIIKLTADGKEISEGTNIDEALEI
jgi:hypothetical protein